MSPGLPLKHDFSQDKSVCFHAGRDLVGKHSSKDCLSDMSLQIYVTLNSKAFQGHEFQICSKHSINKNGSKRSLYIMTLAAWLLLEEMDGNAFSRK